MRDRRDIFGSFCCSRNRIFDYTDEMQKDFQELYDICSEQEIRIIDLERNQKWIPCSERLPEKVGHYLCSVTTDQNAQEVTNLFFNGEYFQAGWLFSVDAWMPLPEPYVGKV